MGWRQGGVGCRPTIPLVGRGEQTQRRMEPCMTIRLYDYAWITNTATDCSVKPLFRNVYSQPPSAS